MKRIMIITVATLLLLSLACQRTPKIPTVVPKDQEAMLGKADQQTTAAADTIPAHYTYDVTDESLLVHVDADVLAKRTDLPVVRVAAEGFSQETAKNMFDYWFAGEPAYQNPRYQEQTKSEIEPMLQRAYEMTETKEYLEYDWEEEEWKEHIAMIEEEYRNAPEVHSSEPRQEDGTLHEITSGKSDGTIWELDASSDTGRWLSLHSDPSAKNEWLTSSAWFVSGNAHYPSYNEINLKRVDENTELPKELTLTYAEAVAKGDAIVQAFGEPMQLHSVFLVDDEQDGHQDDLVQPAESYALQLYYTRTYNGIPLALETSSSAENDQVFSLYWQHEFLLIVLDNNGIDEIRWQEPLTFRDVVVEHSNLLPFEQIRELSEQMYPIIYKTRATKSEQNGNPCKIEVNVDRIDLELMRIREQNVTDARIGLAVPTWVFYGTVKMIENPGTPEEYVMYQSFSTGGGSDWPEEVAVLAINAVDGSLINPILGY